MTRFLNQIGSLFTRALNVFLFLGYAHMTTSARAYDRGTDSRAWELLRKAIDLAFSPFEPTHCARVWQGRVARAHETVRRDNEIRAKRGLE